MVHWVTVLGAVAVIMASCMSKRGTNGTKDYSPLCYFLWIRSTRPNPISVLNVGHSFFMSMPVSTMMLPITLDQMDVSDRSKKLKGIEERDEKFNGIRVSVRQ